MNPQEYQKRTSATAMFPREQALNYLVLGLCSEIAELFELYVGMRTPDQETEEKELGDVTWYCAEIANLFGITLQPFGRDYPIAEYHDTYLDGMAMYAGLLAGKAKKVIRDGRPMDPEFVHKQLGAILWLVEAFVGTQRGLEPVLDRNIEKLSDRHARGVIGGNGDNR